jgi:hypothetical protein
MDRARVSSRMAASIPFGAAHRVYFDTPPLKGRCLAPFSAHWRCADLNVVTELSASADAVQPSPALHEFSEVSR